MDSNPDFACPSYGLETCAGDVSVNECVHWRTRGYR